ncbi:MAG: VWA domain-containing protein [Pseudomonadota bacterium]
MVGDFHFLRPEWLALLVPVGYLLWRWHRRARRANPFGDAIDPELLQVLLEPGTQRDQRLLTALLAATLLLGTLALAGPAWERLPQPVSRDGDALVLLLDLSLSMYARDVEPTRLVRARQKLTDVLRLRKQGYTALVAYAGDAHTVAPLTDDTDTITNLLGALAPNMMPVLGSNPDRALSLARTLFESAGMTQGRILLVTDGVDNMSDVTRHRSRDFPISVLGIGTAEGGPIPLDFANQPGRVLQSDQGDVIRARLDAPELEEIASLCHGRYATAGQTRSDLDALLNTPLPGVDELIESERQFDQWADRGYWLALALVPLLALGFRRGTFASPLLALGLLGMGLTSAPPAQAGLWQDLWLRPDQQARIALRDGSPERAAALFEDERWAGVAHYRSRNYDAALNAFAPQEDAESLTARYNQGNALAHLGRFEEAISAYDEVLTVAPDHEDAAFNKALLEKLMDQQQQVGDGESSENEQGDQRGESQQQQNADNSDDGGAQAEGDNEQPPDGDPGEDAQEASESQAEGAADSAEPTPEAQQEETAGRDANAEAMEQWLRRVPDDPGGLLRRKFQYETNQRRRRGEGVRDAKKIW